MNAKRIRTQRREGASALERLEAGLKTPDEAAWYAETLERLGRVMFGDLWKSGESKAANENTEPS